MLSLSFAQFANGDYSDYPDDPDDYELYVAKSPKEILYIGHSTNVWNRWFSSRTPHMVKTLGGWFGCSTVGQEITDNMPQANDWIIELWTLEDCIQFCKADIERVGFIPDRLDAQDLEPMMIMKLHPVLNRQYNTNGRNKGGAR